MIMADKIIELRKKNGWSQEELAKKLGVSRQSVSKWEGALSTPDLNKVIAMASLFGVSTDYLLKDELTETAPAVAVEERTVNAEGVELYPVSMEDANAYLLASEQASKEISLGVLLCILSPIPVILLALMGAAGRIPLTEDQGGVVGTCLLLLIIVCAVYFFIKNGIALSRFEYLETEAIDTAYGITGMVKEKKQAYERTHIMGIAAGVIMIVCGVIPLLLSGVFSDNDLIMGAGISAFLAAAALGVYLIVRVSIIWDGYQKLLEEGEYSRKQKSSISGLVNGIYWSIVTAAYLAVSFLTMRWDRTWIIWPVAAVLSGVINLILQASQKKSSSAY